MLLSDGSDLKGVNKVLEIKYIRVLRLCLRMLTAWPYKHVGEKESKFILVYRAYTFFIELACLVPGILYIYNNAKKLSFFEMGNTYITVLMNIVAVTRLEMIFRETYHVTVAKYINEMHLFNHRYRSDYAMKIHLLVHKISNFYTLSLAFLLVMGLTVFNALPLYNNFMSGALGNGRENVSFEHAVYYSLPFDYRHSFKSYIFVALFNYYISVICSGCFCIFDILISLLVFQIWGHLKILVNDLDTFSGPRNNQYYTAAEREEASARLRTIIRNHQIIMGFLTSLIETFGKHLAIYYGFHLGSCCLLLLECSPMDAKSLLRYGPLTFIIFQSMIQLSVIFEMVSAMPENLTNAVYKLPWEYMDTSERKVVHIVLRQCQRPMSLKALSIVNVGCQTMIAIIKTSVSYFIMLRTMAMTEN